MLFRSFLFAGAYDRASYRMVLESPGYKSISTSSQVAPAGGPSRREKPLFSTPEDIRRDRDARAKAPPPR